MAGIDSAALGAVSSTRRALGLPALTIGNALGALTGKNKHDAERQRNIEAMLASGDVEGLRAAAQSWAGGGKEMAQHALASLGVGDAASAVGGPAPAARGGVVGGPDLLGGIGSTLRRLNGGKALTIGNAVGGAARNIGGAVGGIGGAVGSALGGLGGFARDHAGELAGAGVAALGIPEMQRANRLRDQALGAVPEEAALGLPGSLDVDPGAAINPADSARLDRYRSLTDQSLEGLQGPSRTDLAMNALSDFDTAQGRAGDAAFRRATQLAAAKGGLGSGMLASNYGDVATQLQEQALAKRNELASGVAEGDIGDRFRRLDVTNSLVGQQAGTEAAQRGELRGERGYAAGVQEGNINRRLGAAQDTFGRGVTRAGVRGTFADAADARAGALMGAGADLAAGAANRRAYGAAAGAAMPPAAPQVTPQVSPAGGVGAAGGATQPVPGLPLPGVLNRGGVVGQLPPTSVPVLRTPAGAGLRSLGVPALGAPAGAAPAAAMPHVQPMVNLQTPLPAVGAPQANPTLQRRRPLTTMRGF